MNSPAGMAVSTRSSRRNPETACDNRRSNGKNTVRRQAEQPGIMPTLYGRHLIGNTIFLSLKDVAADLPDYGECPIPVALSPALEQPYREMEGKLQRGGGPTPAAREPPTPFGHAPCALGLP